ncbi:Asp23/Gls24 family envelope stress response protein [Streptomyces fuscigenes]|uniref:Asp23/Gls24 family envelope stress response protein n=1 Tax=Streptomyces fuscigenes TaxID=1528880 RepID=UPI001F3AECBF|nr:Asp23/Gls24 family envelope stress response protein [Streptomyces fuscigenes]MCF3961355.1 Asp23/Gls24 family envelope stress response protein [Streptomyces fuscigenes]
MPDNAPRDQFGSTGAGGSSATPPSSSSASTGATSSTSTAQSGASGAQSGRRGGGPPASRGRTTIADGVVEKIAGLAARDVVGVHAMGSGVSRTFGAMRERVPGGGKSVTRGVKAEVGEVQTALDLEIVVDYGVAIADVAREVRENVIAAVERMAGLEVVEVNIAVSDVKLPDEEDDDDQDTRVQ